MVSYSYIYEDFAVNCLRVKMISSIKIVHSPSPLFLVSYSLS